MDRSFIKEQVEEMVVNEVLESVLKSVSDDTSVVFDFNGVEYNFHTGFGIYGNIYYIVLCSKEAKGCTVGQLMHYIDLQKEDAVEEEFDLEDVQFFITDDIQKAESDCYEDSSIYVADAIDCYIKDNVVRVILE